MPIEFEHEASGPRATCPYCGCETSMASHPTHMFAVHGVLVGSTARPPILPLRTPGRNNRIGRGLCILRQMRARCDVRDCPCHTRRRR